MSSSSKDASVLNPRTKHYEFLGPPGAFAITLGVPAMTYALFFACSEHTGGCPPPIDTAVIIASVTDLSWWKGLWDTQATIAYLAWYWFTVVAWFILPGDSVDGTPTRNGVTKKYRINGTHHTRPTMLQSVLTLRQRSQRGSWPLVSPLVSSTVMDPNH